MFSDATIRSEKMTEIRPVAKIYTDFTEKFGIPRQSLLVPELTGLIVFEDKYKNPAGIRGIEEFSHLWLLWNFSEAKKENESLTVFPPRLGGKEKRGVFATRSPYRPNGIGLSCVRLEKVIHLESGEVQLLVSGADMLNETPIYDIKPYMPYSDSFPEARGGFGERYKDYRIKVVFPDEYLNILPAEKRTAAVHILEQDPRAAYNKDEGYVYGLSFAGFDIRFTADDEKIVVCDCIKIDPEGYKNVK